MEGPTLWDDLAYKQLVKNFGPSASIPADTNLFHMWPIKQTDRPQVWPRDGRT